MSPSPARRSRRSLRVVLLCALLIVGGLAAAWVATFEKTRYGLSDVVAITPAAEIPAVIFRYDTEASRQDQLVALMHQDRAIGIRASAFPLTNDFEQHRNVLHRYAVDAGEVQLHARAMPAGLANAYRSWNDRMPYNYVYLDQDAMVNSYLSNLVHELRIMRSNGFDVRGLSLHGVHNRLPWDDDTNYRIIAVAAAAAGLEWVSVTTQLLSVGPYRDIRNTERFNLYDSDVTVKQRPFWVTVRTGLFSRARVLVIPTSWRDRYEVGPRGKTYADAVQEMRTDINRQWRAAREIGAPFVLLFHPATFTLRSPEESLNLGLRRSLAEQANALGIPIMTFSDYHAKAKAAL